MARPVLKSEYRISRLNNVLCLGETYSLVSATEIDVELVKIEYFLLAQGLPVKLHNETMDHYKKNAPEDYVFSNYLEIAQDRIDGLIKKLLCDRADELNQPDIAWSHEHNLTWLPVTQIRITFKEQIKKVLDLSQSPALRNCLSPASR